MFRLLIDHDFNHKILRGLVQRIPNLDFVTADQIEKRAESDENHLIWALRNERVIISHDVNTFTDASIKRLNNGEEIYGLIVVPQNMPIGDAVKELEMILECCNDTEFKNRVDYLPWGLTEK